MSVIKPPPEPVHVPEPDAMLYFKRAMQLRCPECGVSPLYSSWKETHSLDQWMHPLPGCPRCAYPYERESGYFLISIWAINYGVVGGLGLGALFLIDELFHLPQWQTLLMVLPFLPLANFLFIRHSKSLFLAMDHYFDPHVVSKPAETKSVNNK